jgi:glycosyltransferase involved in cell wall biosynthesis
MSTKSGNGVVPNLHDTRRIDAPDGGANGSEPARVRTPELVNAAAEPSPIGGCGRVSVVVPARNEAKNLAWVLLRMPPYVSEVILVDGNSTDGTAAIAKAALPDVTIVADPGCGKGAALRKGFAAATGDSIVMLDADGSMDPAEMTRFLALLGTGFELVKGSRFIAGGDSTDITSMRRLGNRVLRSTVNVLYRTRFSDLCYGYCAFRRSVLPTLGLAADGFEIETEISEFRRRQLARPDHVLDRPNDGGRFDAL